MPKCRECEHLFYVPVCALTCESMPCGSEHDTHKCGSVQPRERPLLTIGLIEALRDQLLLDLRLPDDVPQGG